MEVFLRSVGLRVSVPPALPASVLVCLDVMKGVVAIVEPPNVEPGGGDECRVRCRVEFNDERPRRPCIGGVSLPGD